MALCGVVNSFFPGSLAGRVFRSGLFRFHIILYIRPIMGRQSQPVSAVPAVQLLRELRLVKLKHIPTTGHKVRPIPDQLIAALAARKPDIARNRKDVSPLLQGIFRGDQAAALFRGLHHQNA